MVSRNKNTFLRTFPNTGSGDGLVSDVTMLVQEQKLIFC